MKEGIMIMAKLKLGSLFAGIGGIDLGFKLAGVNPVWANEIDEFCAKTFIPNHTKTKLLVEDVNKVKAKQIPFIDILAGGFPCQPFSVAGNRKGFDDDRGGLFFQIIRLIEELDQERRKPKVIFLENVKNMYTHDNGKTYLKMKTELQNRGYHIVEKIMNTCEYGNIPQNRERLYIVGFLNEEAKKRFKWPEKIKLTNTIENVINWSGEGVDKKYFYTESNKCWDLLNSEMTQKHSIYQFRRVYVRENKSGVCPTLTANMGMGGHNVPLIRDDENRIRKLTPRECLSLQGFPETFIIPSDVADSKIYKQAGNSVSVNVIKRIAEEILKALKENE